MGIQGLLPLLKSIMVPFHIKDLRGCRVAVDTYSWLHKGALSCSKELCKSLPTSRLTPVSRFTRLKFLFPGGFEVLWSWHSLAMSEGVLSLRKMGSLYIDHFLNFNQFVYLFWSFFCCKEYVKSFLNVENQMVSIGVNLQSFIFPASLAFFWFLVRWGDYACLLFKKNGRKMFIFLYISKIKWCFFRALIFSCFSYGFQEINKLRKKCMYDIVNFELLLLNRS